MNRSVKKKTGKTCQCGYVFSQTSTARKRKFNSYAVVSDKDYQRFLLAEGRVLRAEGLAKIRAIGRSAALVGSLLECPDCGRILLDLPGATSSATYLREN